MSERYYEADAKTEAMLTTLINDRFAGLKAAKIKVLLDAKPKIDKLRGAMIFASIKLTNEVERYLSKSMDLNGLDYLIFINALCWEMASEKDKKRVLSHELRHTFIDEEGNYKLIRHDIEDFYVEIKLNEDDPMWGQSLSVIAMAKFEQMKADEKAAKAKKKG